MKLQNAFMMASFDEVFKTMTQYYDDAEANKDAYENIFYLVQTITQSQPDLKFIHADIVDDDGRETVYILGLCEDGNDYRVALLPWSEWAGAEVKMPKNMSESEFVAHCIWEMTFFGFTEDEIDSVAKVLLAKSKVVA